MKKFLSNQKKKSRALRFLTLACFLQFYGLDNGSTFLLVSSNGKVQDINFAPFALGKVAGAINPASWKAAVSKICLRGVLRSTKVVESSSRRAMRNLISESQMIHGWVSQSLSGPAKFSLSKPAQLPSSLIRDKTAQKRFFRGNAAKAEIRSSTDGPAVLRKDWNELSFKLSQSDSWGGKKNGRAALNFISRNKMHAAGSQKAGMHFTDAGAQAARERFKWKIANRAISQADSINTDDETETKIRTQ